MFSITPIFDFLATIDIADGFSINGAGENPTSGYMVSLQDCERTFFGRPTLWQVVKYAEDYNHLLCNPSLYVGGWLDAETGKYYLDISENVQDKAQALWLAAERKQLAIFDLSTFESIYL